MLCLRESFFCVLIICLTLFFSPFYGVAEAAPKNSPGKGGGGGGDGGKSRTVLATDDSITLSSQSSQSFDIMSNDSGFKIQISLLNGSPIGNTITLSSQARVSVTADGYLTYDPNGAFDQVLLGEVGHDSFTYTIADRNGNTDTASVAVTINGEKSPDGGGGDGADTGVPLPYYIEGLILAEDFRWGAGQPRGTPLTLSYSFPDQAPSYYSSTETYASSFKPAIQEQREAAREIFAYISTFTNLEFIEVTGEQGDIILAQADVDGVAVAFGPARGVARAGDIWLDANVSSNSDMTKGDSGYSTLLHEIGHALGMTHPSTLPSEEVNDQYTVMAYAPGPDSYSIQAQTYQIFDVATLQWLYGANTETTDDSTYKPVSALGYIGTVWDSGGFDTIDLSHEVKSVRLDLREGHFSDFGQAFYVSSPYSLKNNFAIAYGVEIEGAVGSHHNDSITGNSLGNVLNGNLGDDLLIGGEGADSFVFGTNWGQDTIADFVSGQDKIDLRSLGAIFSDLSISTNSEGVLIEFNGNSILLKNQSSILQSDFVF